MEAQGIPKTEQGAIENDSSKTMAENGNHLDGRHSRMRGNNLAGNFDHRIRANENDTPQTTAGASLSDLPGAVLPVADHAEGMVDSVAVDDGSGGRDLAEAVEITPPITPELPLTQTVEDAEDSDGGNFRFELEFLEQKSGVVVKIRERTRFTVDGKRPSNVLGVFACGKVTNRQLKALRAKTLPPGVKAALAEGDISYEVLKELFKRPGKGATADARKAGQQFRQAQAKYNG